MLPSSVKGSCSIEEMQPEDLLDAVRSTCDRLQSSPGQDAGSQLPGKGIVYDPLGVGHERFLEFTFQDISEAAAAKSDKDRDRHTTNALMNARRCLLCLVDQYLLRDALSYVKNAPQEE